jgi:hypothetical protein
MNRYANAEKILPPELLKEVQKYHTGVLWIPTPSRFYQERRQLVIAVWFKNSSEDNGLKTHHDLCRKQGKLHPRLEKHGMSEVIRLEKEKNSKY